LPAPPAAQPAARSTACRSTARRAAQPAAPRSHPHSTARRADGRAAGRMDDGDDNAFFRLKAIGFGGRNVPILAQNENGPCPLLAIANVLLLRG
jgi:hypothetical protein